jgi:hypothetical protein
VLFHWNKVRVPEKMGSFLLPAFTDQVFGSRKYIDYYNNNNNNTANTCHLFRKILAELLIRNAWSVGTVLV